MTGLAPDFDPATHDYQVVDNDDSSVTVTATATAPAATVVVASAGRTDPLTAGAATVPLIRGRNDVTVTVTSGASSSRYRITIWRLAAPTSQVVAVADAHATVYGGTRMTVTLANGTLPPNNCFRSYSIGGQGTYLIGSTFDPTTGLTKDVVQVPEAGNDKAGRADLTLTNACYYLGNNTQAVTTTANAVTYTAGYHVASADVPTTITSGSVIMLHGTDVTDQTRNLYYWLTDASGNVQNLYAYYNWTGNDSATVFAPYLYGNVAYDVSGPRTFHVGICPNGGWQPDATCTSFFTKAVTWVAPVPTQLSFSPSSGPVAGGTTIRLRGRFIISGANQTTIAVGGQPVQGWNYVNVAAWDNDDDAVRAAGHQQTPAQLRRSTVRPDVAGGLFEQYTQSQDIIEFTAPASTVTGPVPITVTTDVGRTVAAGTFTYSAQPTISSITPATVANSGGSRVTVTGTGFGTTGTPSVIIAGVKSPSVTRVSATRLTAVVPPATGATGPVAVSVSSPQGGGISSAASLTMVAPTTVPTITKITPASGHVSDDVTLTGTGFGPAGTVGVSVGGVWALVTASSATSITFEVPPTDMTGLLDLIVGTTTGALTKTRGFTVLPDAGVLTVTPATVPSYATGTAATIALGGFGFGTTGTVKVGSAPAKSYTATAGGTHIAGVVVPTAAAGSLLIVVTPTGSTAPLQSTVRVTGPTVTYVGPNPLQPAYGPPDIDNGTTGLILDVPTSGGSAMRVEGTGFGASGVLKLGSTTVTTTTWSDTAITFTAPAHAVGALAVTVTPAHSALSASQDPAVQYVTPAVSVPTVTRIASVVDQGRERDEFDAVHDTSNAFTLTGTNLAGTAAAATRVVVSDGGQTFTVVPTGVTATSLTFAAPRAFTGGGWKDVQVTTNVGTVDVNYGLNYLSAGVQLTVSPASGLCLRTTTPATGGVSYTPAVVTIANSGAAFGTTGTVTVGGVAVTVPGADYTAAQVVLDMAHLTAALPQPWGGTSIVITPTDTSLPAQTVGFTCAVTPSVTTTVNGSTNDVTVPAGTSFTPGYTTTGFVGTPGFSATAPDGYEYVAASDYNSTGFGAGVHAGIPAAAGDWYVRVAVSRATYAPADYLGFSASPVRVTITGTPITITPQSASGRSFTYKGQLGDGSNGSSTDLTYTASTTTDPITAVTWEYRDSVCEAQSDSAGWTDGLPKDVALSSAACGGDGVTRSAWDVRVKSFTMTASGTDRSIYYQATRPSVQFAITPRTLTVAAVRADKTYDGTTTATLGALTVTGAVDGDDISLADGSGGGTFADASAGVNKPVTLSQNLALAGAAAGDYTLTNPRPAIVGTISRAAAVLSLASSTSSVLLSQHTQVTITPAVTDSSGAPVADDANAAPVTLASQTPSICTISGTTVTPTHAGTCVIAGTEAASTNYLAATAASDPTSTTETISIQVFPAQQAIAVVADDLTVAVGDPVDPTSEVSGLFDGDTVDGVTYDFYSGTTLLPGAPTDPGTYKIIPRGGSLTAADPTVYSNPTAFTYVSGTLTLTALPPTITLVSPASGPTTGGTRVTVTGTLLDTVRAVRIGNVTLRAGDFTVDQAGTALSFITPRVSMPGVVDLVLVDGPATATDLYTYTAPVVTAPGAPTHVSAVGGNTTIDVVFTPPTATGGTPITAYQVSTDGGRTWHPVTTAAGPGGTRTGTITGVRNGVTYPVQVRAVNTSGAGPASAPVTARPTAPAPVTAPGAPTQLTAVGGNATIAVIFLPPASTGGAPITGYQVSTDGGHTWHPVATAAGPSGTRTATIGGVTNGVTYPVQVRAVNARGAGAASAPAHARPTAPPVTAFDAPTHVTAVGHDQKIDVTFTPPVSTGGSPITHYQVSTDGGRTWHTVATRAGAHGTRTAVVARVHNGVRYPVKVRAVTARRAGPGSGMHPAVPNAPKLGTVKPRDPSEIAIPADPRAYTGPQRYTTARNTSHDGTWAHPISKLGHRQLTKGEAATLFKGSLFQFDSAVLTPDGVAAVANLAGHLRLAHSVSCEGYTDYAGRAAHELTLSQQRAQAICTGLVKDGAHVTFTTHGYGGARPVVVGGTPQSRDDNRRVVVIVTH